MRRAPNLGKILAVGILAFVAVGAFRTWVEAQGSAYMRQSDPVARQSLQLAPVIRYDAAVTDPALWTAPGRMAFNTGTQCPTVYRDGGGWQDICPANTSGVGTFWSEADGGDQHLYPTEGTTTRVKVGVGNVDTVATKLLVKGSSTSESLIGLINTVDTGAFTGTPRPALVITNNSAGGYAVPHGIYFQNFGAGTPINSTQDMALTSEGTSMVWWGYPGSSSPTYANMKRAVTMGVDNASAGKLGISIYPEYQPSNAYLGASAYPWQGSYHLRWLLKSGATSVTISKYDQSEHYFTFQIDPGSPDGDFYPGPGTYDFGRSNPWNDLYLDSMVRFTASNPTSVAGALWYDSVHLQHQAHEAMGEKVLAGRYCVTTADSSAVANTTDETAFDSISCSIGANGVAAGTTFRAKAFVSYGTDATVAPALTLRVKVGGTTHCSIATTLETGASGVFASVECRFTVRTTGAGGTALASGESIVNLTSSASIATALGNASTVAIDTTAANAVTVTAEWDTADADDTATLQQFSLEAM